MFVFSIKHNRRRTITVLAVLLAAVTVVTVVVCRQKAEPQAVASGKKYSLTAAENKDRVAFFKQFGWEVKPEAIDSGKVTIPQKFNDVYIQYNNIQKEQGLDLMPYAGKTVEQWIYLVTNYPQQETMRGTLLVSGGKVIGGDLCTPALDGFMTGFDGRLESTNTGCSGSCTPARDSTGALTNGSASSPAETADAKTAKKVTVAPSSSAIPANAWPTD